MNSETDKIIEVKDLKKSYGGVKAVKGISFYVETGKLFAFLGPNGAGKSTTINMICTFLKPDEGVVMIDGKELGKQDEEIRSLIGVVFQDNLLDDLLTVKENLYTRGSFYGLSKEEFEKAFEESTAATGIKVILNRQYGKLSGGQKRRVDIARALINRPKILFLDEPTTGLDPQTRKTVWEMIRDLQVQNNMTVFLTTHYMEEAAKADYVMVIDDGLIAANGTPTELKSKYAKDFLKLSPDNEAEVIKILEEQHIPYLKTAECLNVNISSTMEALPVLDKCREHINGFEVVRGTMDDAFIGITGEEIRE